MTLVGDLRDMAENLQVPVPKNAEGYVYYAEAMLAIKAADRIEALEKALRGIYALATPDQYYLSEKSAIAIFEIARATLEEECEYLKRNYFGYRGGSAL